jgi:hypothetical protein
MVVAKLGLAAGLNLSSWWCTPPFAQAHKDQIYTLLLCIVLLSRYSFDSFLFFFHLLLLWLFVCVVGSSVCYVRVSAPLDSLCLWRVESPQRVRARDSRELLEPPV